MGATPKSTEGPTYYHIVEGKFAKTVSADTPGAVKRHSEKKKKDVYELLFTDVSGTIKQMYVEDKDFGDGKKVKQLVIKLDDVGLTEVITFPVESKYFRNFCAKIGSINIKEPVKIAPYNFKPDDGNRVAGVNLFQGDNKAGYFFTKENPKGCPMTGEEKLNDSDWKIFVIKLNDFFISYIASFNMGKGSTTTRSTDDPDTAKKQNTAPEVEDAPFTEEESDLPF